VKKVQLTRIESPLWAFQRIINQSHAPPLTFPKWAADTQTCHFLHRYRQKSIKSLLKVSLSNNFQRQSCSVINYLSNDINILAGDDPVPVKFGPKGTDPIGRMRVSHFACGALCGQR